MFTVALVTLAWLLEPLPERLGIAARSQQKFGSFSGWCRSDDEQTRGHPAAAAPLSVRWGQSASLTTTDSITTFSLGLPELVPTASTAATTSKPATTLPNRE